MQLYTSPYRWRFPLLIFATFGWVVFILGGGFFMTVTQPLLTWGPTASWVNALSVAGHEELFWWDTIFVFGGVLTATLTASLLAFFFAKKLQIEHRRRIWIAGVAIFIISIVFEILSQKSGSTSWSQTIVYLLMGFLFSAPFLPLIKSNKERLIAYGLTLLFSSGFVAIIGLVMMITTN